MNGEDLYNGVTNIRDDLVEGAEKIVKKKPFRRRRWMVSTAAVLLVALTLTVILDPWGVPGGAYVIAAAKYPKQTQYHLWNETAWREDRSERLSNREIYQGTLGQFETEVLEELLQGAGSENRVCSPDNLYMALAMLAEVQGRVVERPVPDPVLARQGQTMLALRVERFVTLSSKAACRNAKANW